MVALFLAPFNNNEQELLTFTISRVCRLPQVAGDVTLSSTTRFVADLLLDDFGELMAGPLFVQDNNTSGVPCERHRIVLTAASRAMKGGDAGGPGGGGLPLIGFEINSTKVEVDMIKAARYHNAFLHLLGYMRSSTPNAVDAFCLGSFSLAVCTRVGCMQEITQETFGAYCHLMSELHLGATATVARKVVTGAVC